MHPSPLEPRYLVLKRFIAAGIAQGKWPAHARIPSEGELTRRFSVSRMTANRALRELADEGVITRVQGLGSFVAGPKTEATMVEVRGIRDEIEARGEQHAARVLALERTKADATLAEGLELEPGSVVFRSLILHSANRVPLQLEERFVAPRCAPRYLEQDLAAVTPHEYLMQVAPLERAEHIIEAEMPGADVARLLGLTSGEPLLILRRRTWSQGAAASMAKLSYPASRFRLTGQLQPRPMTPVSPNLTSPP